MPATIITLALGIILPPTRVRFGGQAKYLQQLEDKNLIIQVNE